jgi:MFS family permease
MSALTSVIISRHAWITLGILSSTLLVVFFSETMLLPAIPEIMKDFSIPYGTAAWIFSSYLIVAAVMTPIAGKMSDLYGKKKVLLILLTLYVAGLTAGGFAHNITFLLASRIIQGVGLAAVPAAFSLLRDTFPPAKLAIAVGVFGSAYSAGSVVGLLAGATIIQMFGWQKGTKITIYRHEGRNGTFNDNNFISYCLNICTEWNKLKHSATDRNRLYSFSNFISHICFI